MPAVFDYPIITNDQSIDKVLGAGLPVQLIFHDGKLIELLEESISHIAKKYAGKILVAKINSHDNPSSKYRFDISLTPALITYKAGNVISIENHITDTAIMEHAAYLAGDGPKPHTERTTEHTSPAGKISTDGVLDQTNTQIGLPINVTDDSFNKAVMFNNLPVLVDFWAPWCGPCRMTEPILEKLAKETKGKLIIAKLNVDDNPVIANRFGVRSIPTMMLVKKGNIIDRWTGALPEQLLRQRIAHIIS